MIEFKYFLPREDLRQIVGSYYDMRVPVTIADIMRSEIANIRFILSGEVYSDLNGTEECYKAGDAILSGPTFKWSHVGFSENVHVIGAAITPLGWSRLFNIDALELADKTVLATDYFPDFDPLLLEAIFEARNDEARVNSLDRLISSHISNTPEENEGFLKEMTLWLTNPEMSDLDAFLSRQGLSHRQIERLCKAYFGSAPKRLHRKFRALHAANRLVWNELTDWRDIAGNDYYDQSHFIREFKQFNGRTPSDFIKGAHLLVRQTLNDRRQISHESPFSLVG